MQLKWYNVVICNLNFNFNSISLYFIDGIILKLQLLCFLNAYTLSIYWKRFMFIIICISFQYIMYHKNIPKMKVFKVLQKTEIIYFMIMYHVSNIIILIFLLFKVKVLIILYCLKWYFRNINIEFQNLFLK